MVVEPFESRHFKRPIRNETVTYVRGSYVAVFATIALSLAVWVLFYYLEPPPLTAAETTVVVGMCAAIVLFAKWIRGRLVNRKKRK